MSEKSILRLFCSVEHLDLQQLDWIYQESSAENAVDWYPELTEEAALQKYVQGHHEYLENEFFPDGGLLMVLEAENRYVSALRLYPQEPDRYYMEALETRPDEREKGFAKSLLLEMLFYLHEHSDVCTVRSHVSKHNLASLRTHAAAGFHAETDYVMEDGVRDGSRVCLIWNNGQYSRISRFEKMLDRLSEPSSRDSIPEDVFAAELKCLAAYYSSRSWREDYEADEKGQLPPRLKRGVLSQDAVYDLLSEHEDLLR